MKKHNFTSLLPYRLANKAQLLYTLEKYKEAQQVNTEALEFAQRTGEKSTIFQVQVLEKKILFKILKKDKDKISQCIQPLQKMLTEVTEKPKKADINYELGKMELRLQNIKSAKEYCEEALKLYQELYKKTPKIDYKNRMEELTPLIVQIDHQLIPPKMDFNLISSLVQLMNPETAYTQLLHFISTHYLAEGCQIIITNPQTEKLETRAVSPNLNGEEVEFSKSILQQVMDKGQSLCVPNAIESPELMNNPSIIGRQFLSVIAVPIAYSGKTIGAVYLDRRDFTVGSFSEENVQMVEKIAEILTPILIKQEEAEQARIYAEVRNLGLFIGNSPNMQKIYSDIKEAAKIDFTVYIQGETGTGKGLAAKALYQFSEQRRGAFIPVNCASIPKELAESELFGHAKGAFTGAVSQKKGKFQLADGGILFLDEIGELSLDLQAKLLKAIEDGEIWPVGAHQCVHVNTRIIVATHKNLYDEVKKGTFREDLYHRLDVLKIEIPPLRERQADIPLLAYHFAEKYRQKMKKNISGFSPRALEALQLHQWKGNIRELENTIAKAIFRFKGDGVLKEDDLFPNKLYRKFIATDKASPEWKELLNIISEENGLNEKLDALEKYVVKETLKKHKGNKLQTYGELKIDHKRLNRLLKKHQIRLG